MGKNPSPVFRERINHAIDLYQSGLCHYIIITGGKGFPNEPGESVIGREYAVKNGVPESDIFIENYSKSTEENIRYAQQVAAKHSLTSFFLVSDSYHLRRAAFIANHYGLIVYPSPTPTSVYRSSENKMQFLFRETYFMILCRLQFSTGFDDLLHQD